MTSNMLRRIGGFTLVELVIAISVIIILVGIAIPVIGTVQDDAKVATILSTVEALKKGVKAHYSDTGQLATEYSGSSYQGAQYHELSLPQVSTTWRGPYIDHPMTTGDNPFGGFVYLYENFGGGSANPGGSFKLTGPSGPALTGAGQFVGFSSIPEHIAEGVDKALDDGVPGDWKSYGSVEWNSSNGGTLMIFLMDT